MFVVVDAAAGEVVVGPGFMPVASAGRRGLRGGRSAGSQGAYRAMADGVADRHQLRQLIRRTVGRWVSSQHRRRPMIIPVVVEGSVTARVSARVARSPDRLRPMATKTPTTTSARRSAKSGKRFRGTPACACFLALCALHALVWCDREPAAATSVGVAGRLRHGWLGAAAAVGTTARKADPLRAGFPPPGRLGVECPARGAADRGDVLAGVRWSVGGRRRCAGRGLFGRLAIFAP